MAASGSLCPPLPFLLPFSTSFCGLIVRLDSCMFYDDLAVYEGFGGIVLAKEEGERLAAALGPKHKNAILQNHG